jgi:hypothetical protein
MATLTGQTIASTYDALLKVTDNGPITSSLKLITDGLGNNTALSLSNAGGLITGTFSVSSTISASNLSGTNTGDETLASIKTKLGAASASQDGYLTLTDWSTFNNKVSTTITISTTAPLSGGGDLTANRTLSISQANTTTNGFLSSTDWNTFNNKQSTISLTTTGTSGAATLVGSTLNIPQYQAVLTNPITGSLTTNYVPKASGTTTLGNSNIQDSGTLITLGSNSYINGNLQIGPNAASTHSIRIGKSVTGAVAINTVLSDGSIQPDVTSFVNNISSGLRTSASAFVLSEFVHFVAQQTSIGVGSSVTTQTGFEVDPSVTGATNNFGFRGRITSGTNRWNLYMDGTANNYIAGSLGIGSTSLTARNLVIDRTITGSTTGISVLNSANIASDVTTDGTYFRSISSTQASAFTLTNLYHFRATQGTFGASSVVTNQYGFHATSNLTGATNDYGFYGDLASATGSWNLYMNGTAANYINGTTLMGSTTDNGSTAKLQVTGGISYQNIFNRQTASYTLVLTDQNKIVETNVATANNLTVPLNSSVAFPIGTEIAVLQYGAGQTTIVATSGVTLRAKSGALKISGQYAGCTLVKVGTDEWYVIGDLTI